jgi:hypothetical protein
MMIVNIHSFGLDLASSMKSFILDCISIAQLKLKYNEWPLNGIHTTHHVFWVQKKMSYLIKAELAFHVNAFKMSCVIHKQSKTVF